jgi:hypothetical protein
MINSSILKFGALGKSQQELIPAHKGHLSDLKVSTKRESVVSVLEAKSASVSPSPASILGVGTMNKSVMVKSK